MSKYVREVDSISGLRNTPTSDAAAAHVRTPSRQSGIFVPMDGDPFGNGDDGAVAVQASDGTWWVRKDALQGGPVRLQWFAERGVASDQQPEIQSAIDLANQIGAEIYGEGVFYIDAPLNLKDNRTSPLRGAGNRNGLTFKAFSANASPMLDIWQSDDVTSDPVTLSDFFLDGQDNGVNGIELRNRHNNDISDVRIENCALPFRHADDYLSDYRLIIYGCERGALSEGLSNRCNHYGTTIANTGPPLYEFQDDITAGTEMITFFGCDMENNGKNTCIKNNGAANVVFEGCYVEGTSPVVLAQGGEVIFNSSRIIYHEDPGDRLAELDGGDVKINGGYLTNPTFEQRYDALVADNGTGKLTITNLSAHPFGAGSLAGRGEIVGGTVGRSSAVESFCSVHGQHYTANTASGSPSITESVNGNFKTFAFGGSGTIVISCPVANNWVRGTGASLLLEYESDVDLSIKLAGGTLGQSPTLQLADASSGSGTKTMITADIDYDADTYDFLNIEASGTSGDEVTIRKATLADTESGFPLNLAYATSGPTP